MSSWLPKWISCSRKNRHFCAAREAADAADAHYATSEANLTRVINFANQNDYLNSFQDTRNQRFSRC